MSTKKVGEIIREECDRIEERCDGYKEKIVDTLYEIIEAEEQHAIRGTNIQQQVDAVCNATGDFLARKLEPASEIPAETRSWNTPSTFSNPEDEDDEDDIFDEELLARANDDDYDDHTEGL